MEGLTFMKNYRIALAELHQFSHVGIFIYGFDGTLIDRLKPTMADDLPQKYVSKILKITKPNFVRAYIVSPNENLSVIRFEQEKVFIILWSMNRIMSIDQTYEDRLIGVSTNHLIALTKFLYFALFNELPENLIPVDVSDTLITSDKKKNSITEQNRELGFIHNDYFLEKNMIQAVEEGNMTKFDIKHETFIKSGHYGQMAVGNELRQKKDLTIAAITLFTRAAIRGGVLPDAAFALSDSCVQKVEAETTIHSVNDLIRQIAHLFIDRVRNANKTPTTILIYQVEDYIYKHLNEKLLLSDIASSVSYSTSYLCKLFKRETGQTITQYIMQQRVTEIESQLIFTKKTLTEISNEWGFGDPSYLTKTFEKVNHISPSRFRRKHQL